MSSINYCSVGLLFGSEPPPSRNPHGDALQFLREFETNFGIVHPPFMIKSYKEVGI